MSDLIESSFFQARLTLQQSIILSTLLLTSSSSSSSHIFHQLLSIIIHKHLPIHCWAGLPQVPTYSVLLLYKDTRLQQNGYCTGVVHLCIYLLPDKSISEAFCFRQEGKQNSDSQKMFLREKDWSDLIMLQKGSKVIA